MVGIIIQIATHITLTRGQSPCALGMLIIDGGTLQNADIEMIPGSQLVIRNNGVINMAPGKTFSVPQGVEVYIESGKIN